MKNVTYISAGAGSGKTFTLTRQLTELIKTGRAKPEEVILTTFTNKAADEFKEKARLALCESGLYDEAARLEGAMIGTVHSVCQRMVEKYWFVLGLSPSMSVMPEEDADFYVSQSLADLPTDEEMRFLHRFRNRYDIRAFSDNGTNEDFDYWKRHLMRVIELTTNYEIADYAGSLRCSTDFMRQFVDEHVPPLPDEAARRAALAELRQTVSAKKESATKDGQLDAIRELYGTVRDAGPAWYVKFAKKTDKKHGPLADAMLQVAESVWQNPDVYEDCKQYVSLIFTLADRWREGYARFKREKNLLDFNDMEKYMRLLMENTEVAGEISRAFRYLFVDEFQDSSPIQVKIFDALSDLMEHSYWVGDYKQSIYGFRGSDISLVKAVVDRAASGADGCSVQTLDTSYRSLPDIVEACNDVFTRTFSGVLDEKSVRLSPHRTATGHRNSLRYFHAATGTVATLVADLVGRGERLSDIAVLARTNKELAEVEAELVDSFRIPCNRVEAPITELRTYTLITALLQLVANRDDHYAAATIARLVADGFDLQRLVAGKTFYDVDAEYKKRGLFSEVPLIDDVLHLRDGIREQSVASVVESLAIRLNLFQVARSLEGDAEVGAACVQTVINAAYTYEEHCRQMSLPATIDGFFAYVDQVEIYNTPRPDGVQLSTYHKSKGLQWNNVILLSLEDKKLEETDIIKKEVYGVRIERAAEPTLENPYPAVAVRLLPQVFGSGNTKVPAALVEIIKATPAYHLAYDERKAEANRLLYVGMTRARDFLFLYLLPDSKKKAGPLRWFEDVGIDAAYKEIVGIPEGPLDALGIGRNFTEHVLSVDSLNDVESHYNLIATRGRDVLHTPIISCPRRRYVSPSMVHGVGRATLCRDFEERIRLGHGNVEMARVGDCIHQVFAGIEETGGRDLSRVEATIRAYGLENVLTDPAAIVRAWDNLCDELTGQYGPRTAAFHERPFRAEQDGQTIVGSIDLVWTTADGDVLVDFKTCPMGPSAVLDIASPHYAGHYAGQLDTYAEALSAAGEDVIKRCIYYPVSGLLVDVASTEESDFSEEEFEKIFSSNLEETEAYLTALKENANPEEDDDDDDDRDPRTYLLRWNPAISSFTLDDYRCALKRGEVFGMNWSIWEWEELRAGDRFVMLRTGDEGGIVFHGVFTSVPYPGDDWAGKGRLRYYADMWCYNGAPADGPAIISIAELEEALPEIDWRRGHSGQLLTEEQADVIDDLLMMKLGDDYADDF